MARNTLGSLVVRLGLDAAEFTGGLSKSEQQAKQFSDNVTKSLTNASAGIGKAIGIIIASVPAAVYAIDRLTKQTAGFKDLEERTGASAESIAAFSVAADVAGTAIGDVATFSARLSKQLSSVDDESKGVGRALGALNINVAEFKRLDPASQLERLAKAQAQFAEGGGKTAAFESLARNGAAVLPFLKELEAQGGRQVILTQQQIDQADQYADAQARSKATLGQYAQVIASQALPAITAFLTAGKEFIAQLAGIDDNSRRLKDNNGIRDFAEGAATALGFLVDVIDAISRGFKIAGNVIGATGAQLRALASGDLKAYNAIQESASATIDEIIAKEQFSAKLARQLTSQRENDARRASEDRGFKPGKPQVNFSFGVTGPKDDSSRRILDGQLKDLDRAIKDEESLLRDRERFLDAYYRDNELSVADYYETRRQVIADALSAEVKLYDEQLAALRQFASARTTDPKDRIRAEEQIRDVIDKRGKAEHDAAIASITLNMDQTRAVREYKRAIDDVAISLQELRGDPVGAGLARLRAQQEDSRKRFAINGDSGAISQLDDIVRLTEAQLRLNEAAAGYNRVQAAIGIAGQRIDVMLQTGAITEIDAINKRSQLARDYVQVLKAQADEAERQAQLLDAGPVRDEALLRVEQMRVAIEQLAAQTDVLAKKFNDVFAGAFSDALTDFATNAKSAKDIIKDMEKSIVQSISRIASQNISESVFGKDGPLSFLGKGFAGLFGGGKDAASGATGAAALTGAGSVLTTAGSLLATAAASLQAAATAMFASSAGSSVNGIANGLGGFFSSGGSGGVAGWTSGFDLGGGFAMGGSPPVGKLSLVGENGPEWFIPRVPGTVLPNGVSPGDFAGGSNQIIVNVPQGTSRASANQIATEVARRQNAAARRNM